MELNPVTVGLLENEFADYAGNLTTRDNVDYIQGDGRTFLARTDNEYDMIWFVAPDTYAASNAATSGAFVLSESYLYTEEMIAEAYDHLTPDGMVVTQFGDFDFDERPTRTARYLVTAREALHDEQTDFARQTALLVNRGDVDLDRFSTMLLFKNPPEDDASTRLVDSLARVPDTEALHLPDGSLPRTAASRPTSSPAARETSRRSSPTTSTTSRRSTTTGRSSGTSRRSPTSSATGADPTTTPRSPSVNGC